MSRALLLFIMIIPVFIIGCSNDLDYDDNDVAAVVKGEEITVGELRLLHSDEKVLDSIDEAVKAELVKQEVKEMNLDVSGEMEEEDIHNIVKLPSKNTDDEAEKEIREFAESQADNLDMDPEEYYKEFIEKTNKQINKVRMWRPTLKRF